MSSYRVLDIFGNEEVRLINHKKRKSNLFSEYDEFVDKFDVKKTTDDCYTPNDVYDIVLDYVGKKINLNRKQIIRPFFPGGDYEAIDYPDDCVVIDNPPFSIITKICKFFISNHIPFFLFAPHMTAFSSDLDCTHIIASADITYENGATIKTSFVSNVFGSLKIVGDAELHKSLKEIQEAKRVNLPKYEYPDHIITVSKVAYCVEKGVSLRIDKNDVMHYRVMDAQKKHRKTIFGSGFIVSDNAAKAAKEAAKEAAKNKKRSNVMVWDLSTREKQIIESLSKDNR